MLQLTVVGDNLHHVFTIQLYVVSLTLHDFTVTAAGALATVNCEVRTVDGTMTASYSHFTLGSFPSHVELTYLPVSPYPGVHENAKFHGQDEIIRKILAGLISGLALGSATAIAGKIPIEAIKELAKKFALKWVLKKLIPKLVPGIGYIAILATLAEAVYNACKAGNLSGDVFWIGEENTPPPSGALTVKEVVTIDVSSSNIATISGSPSEVLAGRLTVVQQVSYLRLIVGQPRGMLFTQATDESDDWRILLKAETDKRAYVLGDVITIEGKVALLDGTTVSGSQAWVYAAILTPSGEMVTRPIALADSDDSGRYVGSYTTGLGDILAGRNWIIQVRAEMCEAMEIPFRFSPTIQVPIAVS